MSTYTPDTWVMLKICTGSHCVYKVLAGWSGSYTYGSSWKLNSGCTKVTETENSFDFDGYSGSVYVCRKSCYGLSGYTANILSGFQEQLKETPGASIEVMPEETNWLELNYE